MSLHLKVVQVLQLKCGIQFPDALHVIPIPTQSLGALHCVKHAVRSILQAYGAHVLQSIGCTHAPNELHTDPATTQSSAVVHCVKQAVFDLLHLNVLQELQSN